MGKYVMVLCAVALAVSPVLADPPERLSDAPNMLLPPTLPDGSYSSSSPTVSYGLTWFDNEAAFKAAAGPELCLEDFEESTMIPNAVLGIDDPLCSGVPAPEYPNGLEGCKGMCVQSNLSAGAPVEPNPRGIGGIALASVGFLGACSDIALANTFVDSMDTILDRDDVFGVGGNTLTLMGGATVDIRVYDTKNGFLGQKTVPADVCGNNFVGVISDGAPIGRINVFDAVGGGAEGLDNIQLHAGGGGPEELVRYKVRKAKLNPGPCGQVCDKCPYVKNQLLISDYKCGDPNAPIKKKGYVACGNGVAGCYVIAKQLDCVVGNPNCPKPD